MKDERSSQDESSEYHDSCPDCGNDPLESSQNVDVELSDGVTIKGYLCGGCGIIYVTEPNETARTERVRAEKRERVNQ